jgi:hypothetical protein
LISAGKISHQAGTMVAHGSSFYLLLNRICYPR